MTTTTDITGATDNTLDAFFAVKAGEGDDFDWESLTSVELMHLAEMLPEMNLTTWILTTRLDEQAAKEERNHAVDYEGAILERQDRDFA